MKSTLYFLNHNTLIQTLICKVHWWCFYHVYTWFPPKKIDSNSRTFQDFFSLFPGLFAAKVQDYSRTFNEIRSCMNSNNIYFLQNKNIHPVVYRNNGSFYSKCKKQIPFVIYIIYYYIDLSLLEIDPLY